MMPMPKKKYQEQGIKASHPSHGGRQYIRTSNQYHIYHNQPKSRKRSNDIIIDISNLKRSSCIEYQYYVTKSSKVKKQHKEPPKSPSHHEYDLHFKQSRVKQQKKVHKVENNDHRRQVGKIMKNFHNEKLTQATQQTPKRPSTRKRFYSQSYSNDPAQIKQQQYRNSHFPCNPNKGSKVSIKNYEKDRSNYHYNTLLKSENKTIGISASANEYFCQVNIKCNKSNRKSVSRKSVQRIDTHRQYQFNEISKCSHKVLTGNRKRSQTVAVNTNEYIFEQKPSKNKQFEAFHEYQKTQSLMKEVQNDKTCLSKQSLLEEVIFLRNLALKLYQQKSVMNRKMVPETIQQYQGYEE